jgi:hypothetical protein
LNDLKKQEEIKINELDLELTYLKKDMNRVKKLVAEIETYPHNNGIFFENARSNPSQK